MNKQVKLEPSVIDLYTIHYLQVMRTGHVYLKVSSFKVVFTKYYSWKCLVSYISSVVRDFIIRQIKNTERHHPIHLGTTGSYYEGQHHCKEKKLEASKQNKPTGLANELYKSKPPF